MGPQTAVEGRVFEAEVVRDGGEDYWVAVTVFTTIRCADARHQRDADGQAVAAVRQALQAAAADPTAEPLTVPAGCFYLPPCQVTVHRVMETGQAGANGYLTMKLTYPGFAEIPWRPADLGRSNRP